jgi:hypothetical protein
MVAVLPPPRNLLKGQEWPAEEWDRQEVRSLANKREGFEHSPPSEPPPDYVKWRPDQWSLNRKHILLGQHELMEQDNDYYIHEPQTQYTRRQDV